jgi:molybdopterin synthase sulfur carrier subunit
MMIKVRFFAALREKVGRDSLDVHMQGSDLMDLLEPLRGLVSEVAFAALNAPNVRIAVNREFVEGGCTLRDGDEVAFMPPITGG